MKRSSFSTPSLLPFLVLALLFLLQSVSMAHQTHKDNNEHPPHPPGGFNPKMTVIDAAHPLSKEYPRLDEILTELKPEILESYLKAHHHLHHHASTKPEKIHFQAIGLSTQVVAGINYYVKMLVENKCHHAKSDKDEGKEYIHVRIFDQPWTKTLQLTGLLVNKHYEDSMMDPFPANE